jgi:hypothetical protein
LEALLLNGRYEDAIRDATRAAMSVEKLVGPDNGWLVPMLTTLGKAYLAAGEAKHALTTLERAYVLCRPPFDPVDRADTELALARAIIAIKGDRARAQALIAEAKVVYEKSADTIALATVREWEARR